VLLFMVCAWLGAGEGRRAIASPALPWGSALRTAEALRLEPQEARSLDLRAVEQSTPPKTFTIPDICKVSEARATSNEVTLFIQLQNTGSSGNRIEITSPKDVAEAETVRKALFKELDKKENSQSKEKILQSIHRVLSNSNDSASLEEIRKFFNALLLGSGFITSEVLDRPQLETNKIKLKVLVGSLLEIHPWNIRSVKSRKSGGSQDNLAQPSKDEFQRSELSQAFQSYICRRVILDAQSPLNINKIEDRFRLLREDLAIERIEGVLKQTRRGTCPSDEIEDSLRIIRNLPRSFDDENSANSLKPIADIEQLIWGGERKSCLEVRVVKANPFAASVGIDNYSPPSVGSVRGLADMRFRNLGSVGSEFGVGYSNSFTGGNEALDFSYQVPVSVTNQTLQFRYGRSHNRVTDNEDNVGDLGIRGSSELYAVNYRHPFIRTPRQELALSLGLTVQDGQTFIFDRLPFAFGIGPDVNGVSRTSVIKFGQEYLIRSSKSALSLKSQFNVGTDLFGLFSPTRNAAPIPDGFFFSWQGQAQWLKRFGRDHLLITQVDAQLTPNNLLPQQQFVIGGGQSVRGYRQNSRTGDNGVRFLID
jgi:hemolysin activation/secretion protein